MGLSRGLSTASKIAVARWLGRAVRAGRFLAGRRDFDVVCRRQGVRWSLDLREGVQLALYLGLYERTTARRLAEFARPGAIVVDVGANVGAHTLPLARAVGERGRVVAVEPTDASFARLCRNRGLNPDVAARIVPVQCALGAPGGALQPSYYSAWPLDRDGPHHPVHLGVPRSSENARFSTLDDLAGSLELARVDVIKIDVDGGELDVLEGARRVVARDRPIVVFELCPYLLTEPGRTATELIDYFTSQGYTLFDERTLQHAGSDAARIVASVPPRGGRNLVASPTAEAPRPRR
jgi:FkbM family methyltransferase